MPSDPSNPSVQKTVLIVEDNDLNLKLLNDLLEYHGYTVVTTRLGEPALELARQHRPDAVLMDIQLPDISGIEATRRIKADQETRHNSDHRRHRVCNAGRRSEYPRKRLRCLRFQA